MKNVLLLGDSIRMNYQEETKKYLGDGYTVHAPEENCRFAKYTLNSLRFWIDEHIKYDIIHWNNGLWDTAVLYPEDGCFTPLEEYLTEVKKILRELKKTGARIIFATTTPVKPEKAFLNDPQQPKHNNQDINLYNEHATDFMLSKSIVINDLYDLVYPHIKEFICEDLIHLNEKGKTACGKAVADAIKNLF